MNVRPLLLVCVLFFGVFACRNKPGKTVEIPAPVQDSILVTFPEWSPQIESEFNEIIRDSLKLQKYVKASSNVPLYKLKDGDSLKEWNIIPVAKWKLADGKFALKLIRIADYGYHDAYVWYYDSTSLEVIQSIPVWYYRSDQNGKYDLNLKTDYADGNLRISGTKKVCEMIDYEFDDMTCEDSVITYIFSREGLKSDRSPQPLP